MAGGVAGQVNVPLHLQITNMEETVKAIQSTLKNRVDNDSSGYKQVTKELEKAGAALERFKKLQEKPVKNNSDIAKQQKEAEAYQTSMKKILSMTSNIKADSFKLPPDVTNQIKEIMDQVTKFNNLIDVNKQKLSKKLSDDGIDIYQLLGVQINASNTDFDKIEKAAKDRENQIEEHQKRIEELKNKVKESEAATQKIDAIKTKSNDAKALETVKNVITEQTKGSGKNSTFKSDESRSIIEQAIMENLDVDDAGIERIRKYAEEQATKGNKSVVGVLKSLFGNANGMDNRRTDLISGDELKQQANALEQNTASLKDAMDDPQFANAAEDLAKMQKIVEETQKAALEFKKAKQEFNGGNFDPAAEQAKVQKMKEDVAGAAKQEIASQISGGQKNAESALGVLNSSTAALEQASERSELLNTISSAITRYTGLMAIIRGTINQIKKAIQEIKNLDEVITNIAVVTNMSQADLWNRIGEYTSIAQQYGVAVTEVYRVSQIFYQQGLQTNQVMQLTTETLKMAKIAGMDYGKAADAMTVAVRAFNIDMAEAVRVTDVYSALAANFAVSSAEIANAMEKTASSAANVGMSLESTSAFMTVMVQTTRESANNIGSALKSIISRYGEMKASPATLLNVDGEEVSFNKVDTALKSVGISIKDANGQFRDFDDVIMDLAKKWNTLDNNTQRY